MKSTRTKGEGRSWGGRKNRRPGVSLRQSAKAFVKHRFSPFAPLEVSGLNLPFRSLQVVRRLIEWQTDFHRRATRGQVGLEKQARCLVHRLKSAEAVQRLSLEADNKPRYVARGIGKVIKVPIDSDRPCVGKNDVIRTKITVACPQRSCGEV